MPGLGAIFAGREGAEMRKVMYGKQIKPYKGWTGQVLQPVL
jgi:hypothetical protein